MSKKLLVVLGATGNQGGSVAQRFLEDPTYRVRGITRNPSSQSALALAEQGIEIVAGDLDDPASLTTAFAGASAIFSVTNYWEPFFSPDGRAQAAAQGISPRRYAYDVEYRQGKNIADAAAATVDSLDPNGFLVSTLSHAGRATKGRMKEVYHFDAKADIFPYYVREHHPRLAAKMSCIWTGVFMTSWRLAQMFYFNKQPDGTFQTLLSTLPDAPVPHVDINADLGPFVHAISRLPPNQTYMVAGTTCSWTDYCRAVSHASGRTCVYRQIPVSEMETMMADIDTETAREIGDMFEYAGAPGYDGGEEGIWGAEEIRKAGIECPMTSLEEYLGRQDWNVILGQQ